MCTHKLTETEILTEVVIENVNHTIKHRVASCGLCDYTFDDFVKQYTFVVFLNELSKFEAHVREDASNPIKGRRPTDLNDRRNKFVSLAKSFILGES